MKLLKVTALLALNCSTGFANEINNEPFAFVSNFEVQHLSIKDGIANILLRHKKPIGKPARFLFVPSPQCTGYVGMQCSASIIRLDNSLEEDEFTTSTLRVHLKDIFPPSDGIILYVHGPKGVTAAALSLPQARNNAP